MTANNTRSTQNRNVNQHTAPASQPILRVAVLTPVRELFDYLPAPEMNAKELRPGTRLLVPFGHRELVGILLEFATSSAIDTDKLKPVIRALDKEPLIPYQLLNLCRWLAAYYHHPIGDVLAHALPAPLRRSVSLRTTREQAIRLTSLGTSVGPDALSRAPRQRKIMEFMQCKAAGIRREQLDAAGMRGQPLKALIDRGWLEWFDVASTEHPSFSEAQIIDPPFELNADQLAAIGSITASLNHHRSFLLFGATGTGKTEVYLQTIKQVLAQNRQALILVPEIGLTPQTLSRFTERTNAPVAVLHSGLTEKQRLEAWEATRRGQVAIIIGTRSAIFTPLPRLGLIIVDEEHDASYKQQDGFRYSARDLAVLRGHDEKIPVILGSATPSLESVHNANLGKYQLLQLAENSAQVHRVNFQVIDVKRLPLRNGLSARLISLIKDHIANENQVLLFINRRGFAPTLICHDCGWIANCRHCDARMTMHNESRSLRCHHCQSMTPIPDACPACQERQLMALGTGTERIEQEIARHFDGVAIRRIDRDTIRSRGTMSRLISELNHGKPCILVGTQMLAKGHHFPNVTLVGIVDVDAGLFSADFRAIEKMGQLIVQVAGRSGRAEKAGQVVLQTHFADHPLLDQLINQGYTAFATQQLRERREAQLPPFTAMALLRAQARTRDPSIAFLTQVAALLNQAGGANKKVEVLGPQPALMERKAGRFRAHLLFQSNSRSTLGRLLGKLVPELIPLARLHGVRWSLDVDPIETL